ncbi:MAG: Fpg/Nei family DNA glycosylase, partial [Phycisphaerae bacterium]
MPELPDILAYVHALRPRIVGRTLEKVRIVSPFLLRTFDPPIESLEGRVVAAVDRLGKRFVFEFATDPPLFAVVHLMIAGRWRWFDVGAKPGGVSGITQASFHFDVGTLVLTEAGTTKRAMLHVVSGRDALRSHNPGGADIFAISPVELAALLRRENHTLKRSLTDPRLLDGIGNAYSDEILHAAKLSPVMLTSRISDDEIGRLHAAAQRVLSHWTAELSRRFGRKFPGAGEITAFRPEFAVHGKYEQPCPVCATAVQRIRYAENETNYCPRCQTDGKLLADRSLSRLLKQDWPRTIDELERG